MYVERKENNIDKICRAKEMHVVSGIEYIYHVLFALQHLQHNIYNQIACLNDIKNGGGSHQVSTLKGAENDGWLTEP